MIRSLRLRLRAGTRYTGPAAYTSDPAVPRPGFYALREDGKDFLRPLVRLVCVDDAPGDHLDGACHYEIARRTDPAQRQGTLVPLEVHVEGTAEVAS